MKRQLLAISLFPLALVAFLSAAEITSRIQDRLRYGTPFDAAPRRERDLVVHDERGVHGRPYGRFKQWRLNSFGFRSPEMAREPRPGCPRVMVLGASEAFGLYEQDGGEFPARIGQALNRAGCHEVANAAMPGMTLHSMIRFWREWGARFDPAVVVIYPSPMFYLDREPPGHADASDEEDTSSLWSESRLIFHAQDLYHRLPSFAKYWRESWVISRESAAEPPSWFFRDIPPDRLEAFRRDLRALTEAIRARGALPVLVTHAVRASDPPTVADRRDAHTMRMFFPRATSDVLLRFEREAARAVRDTADEEHLPLVDLAGVLDGRREFFADLVHFNDRGAAVVAQTIVEKLRSLAPMHGEQSRAF